MFDSECVCSVSCCKIIIWSRTVLDYKHVLTVWSVKVNWGGGGGGWVKKNVDPKTWPFPAVKESEASPTYFLLNWNRNVPSAHTGPMYPHPPTPTLTPSVFCFFFSPTTFELSATSTSLANTVTGAKKQPVWCHFPRTSFFNELKQCWDVTTAGELRVWALTRLAPLLCFIATQCNPGCLGYRTKKQKAAAAAAASYKATSTLLCFHFKMAFSK